MLLFRDQGRAKGAPAINYGNCIMYQITKINYTLESVAEWQLTKSKLGKNLKIKCGRYAQKARVQLWAKVK